MSEKVTHSHLENLGAVAVRVSQPLNLQSPTSFRSSNSPLKGDDHFVFDLYRPLYDPCDLGYRASIRIGSIAYDGGKLHFSLQNGTTS